MLNCETSPLTALINTLLCCRSQNPDAEAGTQPPPPPEEPRDSKSCCGVTVSQTVSIRWFIVMIAFVGICCAVVGTVLGAMKASGREHLTVSLLMIGQYPVYNILSIIPVLLSSDQYSSHSRDVNSPAQTWSPNNRVNVTINEHSNLPIFDIGCEAIVCPYLSLSLDINEELGNCPPLATIIWTLLNLSA